MPSIDASAQTYDLVALPLSETQWRISDSRRPSNDPYCVVGFIQQMGNVFETTRISHPRERHYFQSFTEALAKLSDTRDEQ
jgi:hypothetical protein